MQHFLLKKNFFISNCLYRILLLVYPVAYRNEYGTIMAQLFRDLCRDAYRQKGFVGLVQLWGRVIIDTTQTAVAEHIYMMQNGGLIMTRKQHWNLLLFTGLPFLLGMMLFLINPAFMEKMFMPNSAQPIGWLMVAAVFILSGAAYFFQRKIIFFSQTTDSANQLTAGSFREFVLKRKEIIFLCNILFLIVPAMLLILLGPAIVMLLQTGLYR